MTMGAINHTCDSLISFTVHFRKFWYSFFTTFTWVFVLDINPNNLSILLFSVLNYLHTLKSPLEFVLFLLTAICGIKCSTERPASRFLSGDTAINTILIFYHSINQSLYFLIIILIFLYLALGVTRSMKSCSGKISYKNKIMKKALIPTTLWGFSDRVFAIKDLSKPPPQTAPPLGARQAT